MDLKLNGKLALVSGSTAGIGYAIASALASEGAKVIINGRTQSGVDKAIAEIKAAPLLGELSLADFVAAFYLPIAMETLDLLALPNPIKAIPGIQNYVLHLIETRPHFKRAYEDAQAERPKINWPDLPEPWLAAIK